MIRSTLDDDGCIDLLSVLRVINQIDQEQAWAICYGLGDLMQRLLPKASCAPIESLAQVHIHRDGYVHEKSCLINVKLSPRNKQDKTKHEQVTTKESNHTSTPTSTPETTTTSSQRLASPTSTTTTTPSTEEISPKPNTTGEPQKRHLSPPTPPITPELNDILQRRPALSESELVASLGIALFWALDYGIPDDRERKLNRAMECLIFQSQTDLNLTEVLEVCINRLSVRTKTYADSHYRGICKSLISDTIDLSIFLEKIYTATMALSDINLDSCLETKHRCDIGGNEVVDDLSILSGPLSNLRAQWRINDWARLWMQVIRELRQRGRFKQALLVN